MILAFDTSSAACTAALFDDSGQCVRTKEEVIGRGHSERLVPMIAELLDGEIPARLLVGVGPGSFTGIRVAVAAGHGMAIGWGAELGGMSSLALLAAGQPTDAARAAAVIGGHGELFVQEFGGSGEPRSEVLNLSPEAAAAAITAEIVVGSGARQLIEARGWGEARDALPSAAHAMQVPEAARRMPPKPVYVRAPDARAREAA